jgi:hypothetical protein
MRQREQLFIDGQTGDATLTTEVLEDASFEQRIAELQASVPAGFGPDAVRILTTLCDGCGATAELDPGNPRYPEGWADREDGDFCPRCQSLNLRAVPRRVTVNNRHSLTPI